MFLHRGWAGFSYHGFDTHILHLLLLLLSSLSIKRPLLYHLLSIFYGSAQVMLGLSLIWGMTLPKIMRTHQSNTITLILALS
jgi:hypothetical protein